MLNVLWVMLGGAIGSGLRYLMAGAWLGESSEKFPVGTLVVNLIGCFFIGVAATLLTNGPDVRPELRLALIVGVLGGFTTFSSYGYETLHLIKEGQWLSAGIYVVSSTVFGLLLAYCGTRVAAALA